MNERDKTISGEIQTKGLFTVCIEEEELDTIRYRLRDIKTYWPKPTIKGYMAEILFDQGRHATPFSLCFDNVEYLGDLIALLSECQARWFELNRQLGEATK